MPRMLIAALSLAAVASPMAAQRVRFTPQLGLYMPTEKLYDLASGGTTPEDFQLEAGPSFGARLGVLFGSRVGVELAGNYVPTTFSFGSSSTVTKQDAKLFTGTGQLILFLLPSTSPLSLFASGGLAVVSRGGVAFTNEAKSTSVGGVVGLGAGLRLGGFGLTIGADLLGYRADYSGGLASQQKTQRDVNLKVGFGVPFGAVAAANAGR